MVSLFCVCRDAARMGRTVRVRPECPGHALHVFHLLCRVCVHARVRHTGVAKRAILLGFLVPAMRRVRATADRRGARHRGFLEFCLYPSAVRVLTDVVHCSLL